MLAWMDLEMTGLDPRTNVIVEIATIITDDELNIVEVGPDVVIHATDTQLQAMDPVVTKMHTTSGLLEDIRSSTVTLEVAGAQTLEFLKSHIDTPKTVPLCGNTIGMDRRFLDHYLPDIELFLHYRSIDVSTLKELARRWYPNALDNAAPKGNAHRAMDDIVESINELKYWRTAMLK